jgi:hypothetical protein
LWSSVEELGGSLQEGRVEQLVDLTEGRVDKSQLRGGAVGLEILPVLDRLNDAVERVKRVDKLLRLEWEPRVAIALDGEVRSRTLVQLLYTVGQAGLSEYDLWGRGPSGESGAVRIVAPMIGARRTGSPPVRSERCVRPAVHLLEEGVRVGLQAGRRPHIKPPDYPSPSIAKPVGGQSGETRPSWHGKVLAGADGGCPTVDGTSLDQIRRIRERLDGIDFAPICRDGMVSADSSVAYRGLLRLLAGFEAREDLEMFIGMLKKGGEKTGSDCPPTTDGQLAGE